MAGSGGSVLVPVAMRLMRTVVQRATDFVRTKVVPASRSLELRLQPIRIRDSSRFPIHPAALRRQGKGRWYSTQSSIQATLRHFSSAGRGPGVKYDRAAFPSSKVASAVSRLPSRAPFASTLRPNLTGGTLSRTAGGYSTGAGRLGGARYFSHSPAAPAEVVSNVSAAVRAFWLSGQKAQFDGTDARSGASRFRAVSTLQEQVSRRMKSSSKIAPGSSIDFYLTPTITAIGSLAVRGEGEVAMKGHESLKTDGLLDVLAVDFARALSGLGVILSDLKRLSALGDLPMTMPDQGRVRVHFPGCDRETVEALCQEAGVMRGIIHQDEDFETTSDDRLALCFPFAPSRPASGVDGGLTTRDPIEWQQMMAASTASMGLGSEADYDEVQLERSDIHDNPWLSSPSAYSELTYSDDTATRYFYNGRSRPVDTSAYEGLEGIHRFLSECDGTSAY